MMDYFSKESRQFVTFDDFQPGNVVVVRPNALGTYEIISRRQDAHYIMDPDCEETWNSEITAKEPVVGKILYIGEPIISKGLSADHKFSTGTRYYLVAITK